MNKTHYLVPAEIMETNFPDGIPDSCKAIDLPEIIDDLESVNKSCEEGYDETWDCTTDEGREGFLDMSTLVERVIDQIN